MKWDDDSNSSHVPSAVLCHCAYRFVPLALNHCAAGPQFNSILLELASLLVARPSGCIISLLVDPLLR